MTTSPSTAPTEDDDHQQKRRRSMVVAALGTIIEWYDFSIYLYVATAVSAELFGDRSGSLILTLGVGAAGFLFRPLGAMVFGHIGDRAGRKAALVISAVLMAFSLLGTAALPGYTAAGIWGGVGMVVLRCLAGFSVGAEYTGIIVFLMESAGPRRRGFAASWAAANSEVGALLAVGLGTLLATGLSPEAMQSWGWRVLYVVGGLLALIMIPLRRLMVETETVENLQRSRAGAGLDGTAPTAVGTAGAGAVGAARGGAGETSRSPLIEVLRRQPRAVLVTFLLSTVGAVSYFLNITYVPTYLEDVVHRPDATSLTLGTIAGVAAIVASPFLGLAADRWGRRTSFGVLGLVFVLTTIPAYALMSGTPGAGVFGAVFLALPAAGWSAVSASAIPEQFAAVGRYSGMALGFNVSTALFGGLSPLIATALVRGTGVSLAPAIYATAVVVVAGVPGLLLMRNMARRPLAECDRMPDLEMASASQ